MSSSLSDKQLGLRAAMVIRLLPHSTSQPLSPDTTRSPLENAENDEVVRDFVVYGVVVVGGVVLDVGGDCG
jgi:hypothetical protein